LTEERTLNVDLGLFYIFSLSSITKLKSYNRN